MGGLIIPGVQVSVVKEVLPQQLAPSGILGIVGFTEKVPDGGVERAGNWNRLKEVFGAGTALSLPEARQALDNGASQLVVAPLAADAGARSTVTVPKDDTGDSFTLTARAAGTWSNGVKVRLTRRDTPGGTGVLDVKVLRPDGSELESHRGLTVGAGGDRDVERALERSSVIRASAVDGWPKAGEYALAGGADATPEQYAAALARLAGEPDVDMVIAAVQDFTDKNAVVQIYSDVIAHCDNLSRESKGRLGLGQVPARQCAAADHVEMAGYPGQRPLRAGRPATGRRRRRRHGRQPALLPIADLQDAQPASASSPTSGRRPEGAADRPTSSPWSTSAARASSSSAASPPTATRSACAASPTGPCGR
jgi:hypothetical protein